ncbi:hypothetical protein [uncultured Corynebacterium sp.]|uniref:hypothetical protein n=1 Tax=uncultured Corynebacterium sp. TaxID=159447 RepID=UPI00261E6F8F|nr:hypothetical protein [uncultured Corynebacterium sp.]
MSNRLPHDALDLAYAVGVIDAKPRPRNREPRYIPPHKKPVKRNPRRRASRPAGPPAISATEARITSAISAAAIIVSAVSMGMATQAHDIALMISGGK